jgi:hypothetical protein
MIKVTIEIDSTISTVQDNSVGLGDSMGELYDVIRQACGGAGFAPETVETWMKAR